MKIRIIATNCHLPLAGLCTVGVECFVRVCVCVHVWLLLQLDDLCCLCVWQYCVATPLVQRLASQRNH